MNSLFEFYWLLTAHYIGDFALQPCWMGKNKMKDPYTLIGHCMIWTGVIATVLFFFGSLSLWKVFFLFFGHLICDYIKHRKLHRWSAFPKNTLDQSFHIFQILIVWLF